jgi:hypothetical protein
LTAVHSLLMPFLVILVVWTRDIPRDEDQILNQTSILNIRSTRSHELQSN